MFVLFLLIPLKEETKLWVSLSVTLFLTLSGLQEWMKESLKVVLTFDFVREILWFDQSNKTSSAVLSYGTIYFIMYW